MGGSGVTGDGPWKQRARCWRGMSSADRKLARGDEVADVLAGGSLESTPVFR